MQTIKLINEAAKGTSVLKGLFTNIATGTFSCCPNYSLCEQLNTTNTTIPLGPRSTSALIPLLRTAYKLTSQNTIAKMAYHGSEFPYLDLNRYSLWNQFQLHLFKLALVLTRSREKLQVCPTSKNHQPSWLDACSLL